jgi:hypothetical protein
MVPKPFAKVVICFGEPIWIPYGMKAEGLEHYRRLLEARLNKATHFCDAHFGVKRPWRKVKESGVPEIGPLQR